MQLDKSFVKRLDLASVLCGGLVVTSGVRTVEENSAVGGVVNSSHLEGLAVDILVNDSRHRFSVVAALLDVGFRRIGIGKSHIHVDCSLSLPQGVLFLE